MTCCTLVGGLREQVKLVKAEEGNGSGSSGLRQ